MSFNIDFIKDSAIKAENLCTENLHCQHCDADACNKIVHAIENAISFFNLKHYKYAEDYPTDFYNLLNIISTIESSIVCHPKGCQNCSAQQKCKELENLVNTCYPQFQKIIKTLDKP